VDEYEAPAQDKAMQEKKCIVYGMEFYVVQSQRYVVFSYYQVCLPSETVFPHKEISAQHCVMIDFHITK